MKSRWETRSSLLYSSLSGSSTDAGGDVEDFTSFLRRWQSQDLLTAGSQDIRMEWAYDMLRESVQLNQKFDSRTVIASEATRRRITYYLLCRSKGDCRWVRQKAGPWQFDRTVGILHPRSSAGTVLFAQSARRAETVQIVGWEGKASLRRVRNDVEGQTPRMEWGSED